MAEDPLISLAARVGERCLVLGRQIATVESCTGGLVGHLITEIPGSSSYYVGGFVTYSDDAKLEMVGVSQEVLRSHGAVSAQAAMAMAIGGRDRTGADIGISVTGIAGPDGGTPNKPVGLTYIAVADESGTEVRRFTWTGSRAENKQASAQAALEFVLDRMQPAADSA